MRGLLRELLYLGDLPEFSMRRIKLEAMFARLKEQEVLGLLEALLIEVRRRNPQALAVYLPLIQLLDSPRYREERNPLLLACAEEAMMLEVRYLFLDPPLHLPFPEEGEGLRDELKSLTLGERKSLARKLRDPGKLLHFIQESDPQVLRIILKNPGLKEDALIRFLAHRPVSGAMLAVIWEEPYWLARARVQRALVLNPYTLPRISLKFLPLLATPDLLEVESSQNLHPLVCEYARKLLLLKDYSLRSPASEVARER